MLNELLLKALEEVVFPAMDKTVIEFRFPFKLDDKLWEKVKDTIRKKLAKAKVQEGDFGHFEICGSGMDLAAFDLKGLLKNFVVTEVFPIIDDMVSKWKTPLELDDVVWKYLKAEIEKLLATIQFVKNSDDEYELAQTA